MTAPSNAPTIRLTLGYFEHFELVAGLLRETSAKRIDSRVFVIEGDMNIRQVAALVQLLEHSRTDVNHPVKVEISPADESRFHKQSDELYDWWGTVADWR